MQCIPQLLYALIVPIKQYTSLSYILRDNVSSNLSMAVTHTHPHTPTYTHIHKYTHTPIHTLTYTYIHTHTPTQTLTYTRTHIPTPTPAHTDLSSPWNENVCEVFSPAAICTSLRSSDIH